MVLRRSVIIAVLVLASCSRVKVSSPREVHPQEADGAFASALATGNNQVLVTDFEVRQDADFVVVAQGEGSSFDLTPGLVESYQNDCVEFYVDLGSVDRQYRFVWNSREVMGKNADMDGVRFVQGDPSGNEYCFEIAFPWKTLGADNVPQTLKMDIAVCDNDGESRKSQITWNAPDGYLWRDIEKFGEVETAPLRTVAAPVIDGKMDEIWEQSPSWKVSKVVLGSVAGPQDLSAEFRLLRDEQNLYLFVDVKDDVKKMAAFMFDSGEILDKDGNEVWKLDILKTAHAGGALKNRRQQDTLHLAAGKYRINYRTDESHAAGHWDAAPPSEEFSGIIVYEGKD